MLQSIVANYTHSRNAATKEKITEIMPVAKCGTILETSKFRYLVERTKTLKRSTNSKQSGCSLSSPGPRATSTSP